MSTNLIQNPEAIRLNEEEEVQQLLGNPPGWMLRWGITLVLIAFIGLIVMSHFFRYPDRITANVVLTSERPPIKIFALERGRINQLLVHDNQLVEAGQLLAVIENPAELKDVELLDQELAIMEQSLLSKWTSVGGASAGKKKEQDIDGWSDLPETSPTLGLKLGPLQAYYAELLQFIDHQYYKLSNDANYQRIKALKSQISHLREMNLNITDQLFLLEKEVYIAEKNEQRLKALWENGAESQINYEKASAEALTKQGILKNKKSTQIDNKLAMDRLREEIISYEKEQSDEIADGNFKIQASMKRLRSAIDEWRLKYTLTTPIKGKVSFSKIWSEHQFVNPDELVMTIVPQEGQGQIIARGDLPVARSGKVETGMIVNIRLENYPYKEYGIVKGIVENIAPVPNQEGNTEAIYQLTVSGFNIPASGKILTTYQDTLDFQQELQGTALIITKNRNLWERLVVDRFRDVTKNQ
ncbi:MAG: HlyD family efflux transporter periplasmic adaptor subunit [Saprospiraceae bacterium]